MASFLDFENCVAEVLGAMQASARHAPSGDIDARQAISLLADGTCEAFAERLAKLSRDFTRDGFAERVRAQGVVYDAVAKKAAKAVTKAKAEPNGLPEGMHVLSFDSDKHPELLKALQALKNALEGTKKKDNDNGKS